MPKKCTVHILHLFAFVAAAAAAAFKRAQRRREAMAGDEQEEKEKEEEREAEDAASQGCRVVLVSRALITALICGISSVHSNSNSYGDSKTVGKRDSQRETAREGDRKAKKW